MKCAKISLAAALALGVFSTTGLAQSLEEAIKGTEVSGMLRYRYTRDSFTDENFAADSQTGNVATHAYRVNVDLKTPVVESVAMNVGLEYNVANEIKTPNENAGPTGRDDHYTTSWNENAAGTSKGVRTFYASLTPMSTKTVVNVGKMRLDTPFNDTLDDRGSGIMALNSDLENITFGLGVFDNVALDDLGATVVAENLGVAAAIAKFGGFEAQLWYATMTDAVKSAIFADVAYTMGDFGVAAQFISTTYEDSTTKGTLFGSSSNMNTGTAADPFYSLSTAEKNSLMVLEGSANLGMFGLRAGAMASGGDSFQVLPLDDEGAIRKAGELWFGNEGTGVSFSPAGVGGTQRGTMFSRADATAIDLTNPKQKLSVIYLAANAKLTDNLNVGLDFVQGNHEDRYEINNGDKVKNTFDFTELTPKISYQYNKSLSLSSYYAMLKTDQTLEEGGIVQTLTTQTDSEKRNRFRFQALYKF